MASVLMNPEASILTQLQAPRYPQRCRACGIMVETYSQFFSENCPNNIPFRHLGHDVPDPYRLPYFKEDNDAT